MTTAAGETPGMWTREGPYLLDWPDLGRLLTRLTAGIETSGFKPTVVCGVARGGLMPACYLAQVLDVPRLEVIRVRRTANDEQYADKRPPVLDSLPTTGFQRGDRVLVVDDIVGTGSTAELVLRTLRTLDVADVRIAALVRNQLCGFPLDYGGFVADDWVIFPWEPGWFDRPANCRPLPRQANV